MHLMKMNGTFLCRKKGSFKEIYYLKLNDFVWWKFRNLKSKKIKFGFISKNEMLEKMQKKYEINDSTNLYTIYFSQLYSSLYNHVKSIKYIGGLNKNFRKDDSWNEAERITFRLKIFPKSFTTNFRLLNKAINIITQFSRKETLD